ncbi:hypothetical protein [Candidatus Leptofilum sp.]|uniref:hypothetical protein n=1 Tax=Candidatus Leptofilum sp. TaxID=3241576 RepID=UPI003B593556
MNFSVLNRLLELETAVAHKTVAPTGKRPFAHQAGNLPVLISAPHATVHQRQHRLKREEGFTGALAQLVAETTGAHALYCRYQSADDPNWDAHSPYKRQLQKIVHAHNIQFVLDLHGMSNRHKIGVALGSMNGRSCPNHEPAIVTAVAKQFTQTDEATAASFLRLHWNHFVLNHSRFTGGLANHTVTRFASQTLGIPAVQIELCAAVRVVRKRPFALPKPIFQAVTTLQNVVKTVAATL